MMWSYILNVKQYDIKSPQIYSNVNVFEYMCVGEIAVFIWDNFKRYYVEWAAYDVIRHHVIYKGYFTITVH